MIGARNRYFELHPRTEMLKALSDLMQKVDKHGGAIDPETRAEIERLFLEGRVSSHERKLVLNGCWRFPRSSD